MAVKLPPEMRRDLDMMASDIGCSVGDILRHGAEAELVRWRGISACRLSLDAGVVDRNGLKSVAVKVRLRTDTRELRIASLCVENVADLLNCLDHLADVKNGGVLFHRVSIKSTGPGTALEEVQEVSPGAVAERAFATRYPERLGVFVIRTSSSEMKSRVDTWRRSFPDTRPPRSL